MEIASIERQTVKKLYWKILPFLILCYIVAFLDRVNLGFAALHMNEELAFTARIYGLGAGIFSIGYFLFEVPSNLVLHKVGARVWIARIMVTWGIISAGFAFVQGETSFYVMRFLLGVAEAGFFPGVVLYLTLWFPARVLASATAIFILGLPISVLIGAPLSAGIIAQFHEFAGLAGWKWMFLIEGGLAVVVGIIAFFKLDSIPSKAAWLTTPERQWLVGTLERERSQKESKVRYSVMQTLMSGKVLLLSFAILCNITALFGITLWMPQIIKGFGGLSNTQSSLLTAVPYLCASVAMVLNARHSDKVGEKRLHILIPACIGGIGLLIAGLSTAPAMGLLGLCIGAAGVLSSNILFWSLPTMFLTGAAAAAGIGLVNSVGNLGGFVGPYVTGWAKDIFGNYSAGMTVLACAVIAYGLIIFVFLTRTSKSSATGTEQSVYGVQAASGG